MIEASEPCCRSSSFPSFLPISPISNGIIAAYNLDGSAVMREIWDVLNDEGMDADIVNEKVMELLESAGSKERAKIMDVLEEISASA